MWNIELSLRRCDSCQLLIIGQILILTLNTDNPYKNFSMHETWEDA